MYKKLDLLYKQIYCLECTRTVVNCTKDRNMARIPFEVSEELKDEFEKRLKRHEEHYGEKMSSSKILRSITSLVATMDSSEFLNFLQVLKTAEHATDDYYKLIEKYGMEHTFDPVPNWDFYKRYQLLLEIESKKNSKRFIENQIKQDVENQEWKQVKSISDENRELVRRLRRQQKDQEMD